MSKKQQEERASKVERSWFTPYDTVTGEINGQPWALGLWPIGIKQIKKWTVLLERISAVVGAVKLVKDLKGMTHEEIAKHISSGGMIPMISDYAIELVEETTRGVGPTPDLKLEHLPHWELPKVLQAWFELNFLQEHKYRPWLTMVTKVLDLMPETPSRSSSRQDTPSSISSSDGNEASPTEAGLSPSTASG